MTYEAIHLTLKNTVHLAPQKQERFFKTGIGDYAEHDQFLGVSVPELRKIAKNFQHLELKIIETVLHSAYNEERLLALFLLIHQYQKSDAKQKEKIFQLYLKNTKHINNWNLVDASAHLIVGAHLFETDRNILLTLAKSPDLWERRIAIVATWYFIRQNDLDWTFKLAVTLRNDNHDLIHKAVGWMLREAGKRNKNLLVTFLNQHASKMPRTMLRYAIEKFPQHERICFLKKSF